MRKYRDNECTRTLESPALGSHLAIQVTGVFTFETLGVANV
jgi:hypothetical protein